MSVISRSLLVLPLLTVGVIPAAYAQSASNGGVGYFMPPDHSQHAGTEAARQREESRRPAARPEAMDEKLPNVPALPSEPAPPTAVIGVLSVPDVLQNSTAAQGVQRVIQQRQAVLAKDAREARNKIQSEQQAIMAERGKLSDSELEKKEQSLQSEIAATQTNFQERNEAIQLSGQEALQHVEAMLAAIVRREAEAHGMNLILHREQVVLNVAAFDITDETAKELNKLLPHVEVPPSVVTPAMAQQAARELSGNAGP